MHRGASRAIVALALVVPSAITVAGTSAANGKLADANVPTERCAQRLVDYLRDKLEE